MGQWQRQQNLASEAWLLPLTLESFIGSSAEAAKSCLLRWLLPLTLVGFIGSSAEAAKKHVGRRFSCLWRSSHLESPSQRQQTSPSEAILVAFGGAPILCPRTKGSRRARRKPFWLPLTKTPSCSHERKATEEPAMRCTPNGGVIGTGFILAD